MLGGIPASLKFLKCSYSDLKWKKKKKKDWDKKIERNCLHKFEKREFRLDFDIQSNSDSSLCSWISPIPTFLISTISIHSLPISPTFSNGNSTQFLQSFTHQVRIGFDRHLHCRLHYRPSSLLALQGRFSRR